MGTGELLDYMTLYLTYLNYPYQAGYVYRTNAVLGISQNPIVCALLCVVAGPGWGGVCWWTGIYFIA
jgi:hypothetical protein